MALQIWEPNTALRSTVRHSFTCYYLISRDSRLMIYWTIAEVNSRGDAIVSAVRFIRYIPTAVWSDKLKNWFSLCWLQAVSCIFFSFCSLLLSFTFDSFHSAVFCLRLSIFNFTLISLPFSTGVVLEFVSMSCSWRKTTCELKKMSAGQTLWRGAHISTVSGIS